MPKDNITLNEWLDWLEKTRPNFLRHFTKAIPEKTFNDMNTLIMDRFQGEGIDDLDGLYLDLQRKIRAKRANKLQDLFDLEGAGNWLTRMTDYLKEEYYLEDGGITEGPTSGDMELMRMVAYFLGLTEIVRRHDGFTKEDQDLSPTELYRKWHALPIAGPPIISSLSPGARKKIIDIIGAGTHIDWRVKRVLESLPGNGKNVEAREVDMARAAAAAAAASGMLPGPVNIAELDKEELEKLFAELHEEVIFLLKKTEEIIAAIKKEEDRNAIYGKLPVIKAKFTAIATGSDYDRCVMIGNAAGEEFASIPEAAAAADARPAKAAELLRRELERGEDSSVDRKGLGTRTVNELNEEISSRRQINDWSAKSINAKGIALHIGLNELSREHYRNWKGCLKAAAEDAYALSELFRRPNKYDAFDSTLHTDSNATRTAIIDTIRQAASQLQSGDLFLLTFSGIGGQIPNIYDPAPDACLKTWCLYDGQLLENELTTLLATFCEGVKIMVIKDCCHGNKTIGLATGDTSQKTINALINAGFRARYMPWQIAVGVYLKYKDFYDSISGKFSSEQLGVPSMKASISIVEASSGTQLAWESDHFGLFTETLIRVWDFGRFAGTYDAFFRAILSAMPEIQSPQKRQWGPSHPYYDQSQAFYLEKSIVFEIEQMMKG